MKNQKKNWGGVRGGGWVGGGGGGGGGGGRGVSGFRVDVNEELKFLCKIKKNIYIFFGGGGGRGGGGGCQVGSRVGGVGGLGWM